MVARGDHEAVEGAVAEQWHVVGRAGPEAGNRLDEGQLRHLGDGAVGLAQQLVHAAGGDRAVEALLLDGGAQGDAAVGAGHEVDARGPDDVLGDLLAGGMDEVDDLALDRAYGHLRRLGQPGRAPGAACQHDVIGCEPGAAGGTDATEVAALDERLHHLVAGQHVHAGELAGAQQREAGLARVGLALAGREDAAGAARREARLELAGAPRPDPLDGQPGLLLEAVQAPQRLGLVAVERQVQGAAAAQAGRESGRSLELRREAVPALVAGHRQHQLILVAELGLGRRGEHPRRDPRRLAPRHATIHQHDAEPALGEPPRSRQADNARANHHDVGRDQPTRPLAC